MLQAMLAPLLAPSQQGVGEPAASLPLLIKLLTRMKATEENTVGWWRLLLWWGCGGGC